jgi:hypothetical protein
MSSSSRLHDVLLLATSRRPPPNNFATSSAALLQQSGKAKFFSIKLPFLGRSPQTNVLPIATVARLY